MCKALKALVRDSEKALKKDGVDISKKFKEHANVLTQIV